MSDIHQDSPAQKSHQESLRASGRQLRAILENSPDLIVALDPGGRIIYINRGHSTLTPDVIVGQPWYSWSPEYARPIYDAALTKALKNHERVEFEVEGHGSDRSLRWYRSRLVPIIHDGEVDSLIVMSCDITEERRQRANLRASEERHRLVAAAIQEGIFDRNLLTDEVHFSARWKSILGYEEHEFPDTSAAFLSVLHPDDRGEWEHAVRAHLEDRVPYQVELRFRHKDGSYRWVLSRGEVLRGDGGKPLRMIGSISDITTRKMLELELIERKSKLRRMLLEAPVAFALNDGSGRITFLNDCFSRMFGYTGEDIPTLEEWWPKAYPDPAYREWVRTEWSARIQSAGSPGQSFQPFEVHVRCKDGSVRCVQASAVAIDSDAGQDHLVSMVDLTELKRTEEQRRQLELQLQHTQKLDSLGVLAGGVAHDMNNVLAAILGIAELHHSTLPAGGRLRHDLGIILHACKRGRTMVQGLLDFARKGLGQIEAVDLNQLIHDEVALLERTTLQKVTLRTELDSGLRPVAGERSALSQALMNVAINAVQAMPDGGTLILRTRSDGESSVILEVEDSGSGMTAEVRARAMDPFFTTKPVGEGSGLGLAIVYGTMKAHGGSVAIQSMPGRGTLVTMTLPAMTNPPPLAEPLPASSRTMASALEILVVDDDTLVQEVMGGLLALLGHLPRVVDSGPAALVYLEQAGAPDVVILDINMPGMDGLTTVGRIWALAPKLPVLIVSGRVESSALDLALEHPNVGFLSKPFTLDELKEALDQLLEPPIPLG